MSGCKINQNMEFGDIFYFILILLFAILGFFNESNKKKKLKQQNSEEDFRPIISDESDEPFLHHPLPQTRDLPPAVPHQAQKTARPEFRSSLDLVTDFTKLSSLKDSIFVYDADDSFAQSASDTGMEQETLSETNSSLHPLVAELIGEGGEDALKKGLIYGEIMQRKY